MYTHIHHCDSSAAYVQTTTRSAPLIFRETWLPRPFWTIVKLMVILTGDERFIHLSSTPSSKQTRRWNMPIFDRTLSRKIFVSPCQVTLLHCRRVHHQSVKQVQMPNSSRKHIQQTCWPSGKQISYWTCFPLSHACLEAILLAGFNV